MTGSQDLSQRAARLVERLKTRKGRAREEAVLVEGVRCVSAALDGGATVRFAAVSPRLTARPDGAALLARLTGAGIDIRSVSDAALAELSDTETPQGVFVVTEEPRTPVEQLAAGLWLVLDAVQDPGNAGTLVRAATAFGAAGVIALDGTVDLWGPKAVRASAGLVYAVPVARATGDAFVRRIEELDVPLLVADAAGEDVSGVRVSPPIALVVGNEGTGVRGEVAAVGRRVAVPMRGPAESLNVGIAGSILLYALSRETPLG